MNQLRVKAAMVAGTAKSTTWSQVHKKDISGGQIFALVTLSYSGEGDLIDLAQIGGSLLEHLGERGTIVPADVEHIGHEITVGAVVVHITQGQLAISGVGPVDLYLKRDGKLGKIFVGADHVNRIAGEALLGDRWIAVSRALGDTLSISGLEHYLQGGTSTMESLAVFIHGSEDSSRMAAIVGEVEEDHAMVETQILPSYKRVMNLGGIKGTVATLAEKLSFKKPLVIHEEKRRWNLMVGSILIVLLIVGVVSGMIQRSRLIKERSYSQLDSSVTQKMQEARSIADLNPERAKLLITQGKSEIDAYMADTQDEDYRARAMRLSEDIKKLETEVFKKQEVQLNTFADLSLLASNLSADKFFVDGDGNLMVPDTQHPRIGVMNLEDKSILTVDLGELGSAKELSTYGRKIFGIGNGGIFELAGKEKRTVITPDDLWGEITLLDSFGGNVYLFDRGQSEIWKYPALTDGFGTRRRWLGAGIQLDLSNVIDMKVDGDIWLLTTTGKLEKYSRGVPVEFSMEGFPYLQGDRLSSPIALFVSETKVYVLEGGASRVAVFDKESGKYERQYSNEVMKEGKDVVVWEDVVYVLLPDKIVWFQL